VPRTQTAPHNSDLQIYSYITILNSKYPNFIQVHDLAMSHEGRPIKSVTIALDGIIGNNPIVFVDNAIQGTDWMGVMSVAYLIFQLIEQSAANLDVLQAVDFVIIPVVNPDGLVHSQTVDRFWSKNRVPIEGSDCVGVNINRNFDLVWQPSKNVSISSLKSSLLTFDTFSLVHRPSRAQLPCLKSNPAR
jgi:Zinc carboxypeptidase